MTGLLDEQLPPGLLQALQGLLGGGQQGMQMPPVSGMTNRYVDPNHPLNKALSERMQPMLDAAKYPGQALAGQVPYHMGMRPEDYTDQPGAPDPSQQGVANALRMSDMAMTGAIPFAQRGAVGAMGGKLPPPPTDKIVGAAVMGKDGQIFSGTTHGMAAANAADHYGVSNPHDAGLLNPMSMDGFITSTGRYVNRDEALKIAEGAKQPGNYTPTQEGGLRGEQLYNLAGLPPGMAGGKPPTMSAEELARLAQQRTANNPMASAPAFDEFTRARLAKAQARGDQTVKQESYRLGPNPSREEFQAWALRPMGGNPAEGQGMLGAMGGKPPSPSSTGAGVQQLQQAAIEAGQAGTKANLPPPKPFMDRIWDNYAKRMTPDEFLQSEALWGNAQRMAKVSGTSEASAFARIANDIFDRMGTKRNLTVQDANEIMGQQRGAGMLSDILNARKE